MAVYKINESKKVTESYDDGTVSIDQLRKAISNLEELISEMEINDIDRIKASPNTYGLSSFFLGTSSGYIDLNDVYSYMPGTEDYEEGYNIRSGKMKESLTEATDPQDYRVYQISMDVAVPGDRGISAYGLNSSGNGKLFHALSQALESEGLEMAGDFIFADDYYEDLTATYKDNDYKFFEKSDLDEFVKITDDEDEEENKSEVVVYSSSEHTSSENLPDPFYGYLMIEHPVLGDFTVSAGIRGDIRLDGSPWKFLKKSKERLTDDQIKWVQDHKDDLARFARTGSPRTIIK